MLDTILLPSLTLDSGQTMTDVPVAFGTWGSLNDSGDNALVICHALTGNADAADWWPGLIGPGKVLDTDQYFVVCANVLGSPYGSASPLTINPATGQPYGPTFPDVTIRDTVRAHRALLAHLGVKHVRLAIGGSMGGMQVLEWGYYDDFVEALIPIAVGSQHSPWCIGWGEAQRQAIYADANWNNGNYESTAPPRQGLSAARAMAMISYRAASEYQTRFGRERMPRTNGVTPPFKVESYLRYQGEKLVERFDANCYVKLTQQMDTHDVSRERGTLAEVLQQIQQPVLVIGFPSDVLYTFAEQEALAAGLPNATLASVAGPYGHDSFLIEFEALANVMRPWMQRHLYAPSTTLS